MAAFAATVEVVGDDGEAGADGTEGNPGTTGSPGADAEDVGATSDLSGDADNQAKVTGGQGGKGGDGGNGVAVFPDTGADGGNGGEGGIGGDVTAFARSLVEMVGAFSLADALGGDGGDGGLGGVGAGDGLNGVGGNGGEGGHARAAARAANTGGLDEAKAVAVAVGGTGGDATGPGATGGLGGLGIVESLIDNEGVQVDGALAVGQGLADATAEAQQFGGNGGFGFAGATGGAGADSLLYDRVGGQTESLLTTLSLKQVAVGGAGGGSDGGVAGAAGNAESSLTTADVNPGSGDVSALVQGFGGRGGHGFGSSNGASGGEGFAQVDLAGSEFKISVTPEAVGGRGGDSVGGFAGDGGGAVLGYVGVENTAPAGETFLDTGAFGGDGGDGFGAGGHGGSGADAELRTRFDSLLGDTIFWRQRAGGGNGGFSEQGVPGIAGDGTSVIGDDESEFAVYADAPGGYTQIASAFGGDGGSTSSGPGHFAFSGGEARGVSIGDNRDAGAVVQAFAQAGRGGDGSGGADGGVGGFAETTAIGSIGGFLGDGDVSGSNLEVLAESTGGRGGDAELGGFAGGGGDAFADARGQSPAGTHRFNSFDVTARALGGSGGLLLGDADVFATGESRGGDATANASGVVQGDITTNVLAEAVGGIGGDRDSPNGDGANGGSADASATLTTANDSFEPSTVTARAVGGEGGIGVGVGRIGGHGGAALVTSVTGTATGDTTLEVEAEQIGGRGGDGFEGALGGNGADSVVMDPATATGRFTNITLTAVGGEGGASDSLPGFGGEARVYYSGGGATTDNVPSVFLNATGGKGGDGTLLNNAADGATGYAEGTLVQVGFGDAALFAAAVGGAGGNSSGGRAGDGGHAYLGEVFGESTEGFPIQVEGTAVGGAGGDVTGGGQAGDGATVLVEDKVDGVDHNNNLSLRQVAIGGTGGSGGLFGTAGDGGDATSRFTRDSGVGTLGTEAIGGVGGTTATGRAGVGGEAFAEITTGAGAVDADGFGPDAETRATGGDGGAGLLNANGGHAGDAHATTTVDTNAGSAAAAAIGGEGGDVQGTGLAGHGGNAFATATGQPVFVEDGVGAFANSFGGQGGSVADGEVGTPGHGGNAVSVADAAAPGARADATAFARAGRGGFPGLDGGQEGAAGTAHSVADAEGSEGFLRARAIIETGLITAFRGDAATRLHDVSGNPDTTDGTATVEARAKVGSVFPATDAGTQVTVDLNALSIGLIAESAFDIRATNATGDGDGQYYEAEAELSLSRLALTPAERSQALFGVLIFDEILTVPEEVGGEMVDVLPGTLSLFMDSDSLAVPSLNLAFNDARADDLFDLAGEYALGNANGFGIGPDSDFEFTVTLTTTNPDAGLRVRWGVYGLNADQALTNGQFEFGLAGWDIAGFDADGTPIETPHITAPSSPAGNGFAQLKTGAYEDGVARSTMQQELVIDPDEPILSFDFTLATVVEDLTGVENDPTNPFTDRVEVLIDDGTQRLLLLAIDRFGVVADPLGQLPDGASLNLPVNPDEFDFNFAADLSALAALDLTLIIDVLNEDDGFRLDPNLDNFQLTAAAPTVPEPSVLPLLAVTAAVLARRRPCGHPHSVF